MRLLKKGTGPFRLRRFLRPVGRDVGDLNGIQVSGGLLERTVAGKESCLSQLLPIAVLPELCYQRNSRRQRPNYTRAA
jgi:hypothetical protein